QVRAAIADSEFATPRKSGPPRAATFAAAALAIGVLIGVALSWLLPAKEALQQSPAPPTVARAAPAAPSAPVVTAPKPAAEPEDEWTVDEELDEYAATLEAEPNSLTPAQLKRLEGYAAPAQTLLAERLAATRTLLAQAPDGRYAIELYITPNSDPAR